MQCRNLHSVAKSQIYALMQTFMTSICCFFFAFSCFCWWQCQAKCSGCFLKRSLLQGAAALFILLILLACCGRHRWCMTVFISISICVCMCVAHHFLRATIKFYERKCTRTFCLTLLQYNSRPC